MTMTVGGTTGLTFPDSSTQNTAATGFGFKNRIINGAMMIDQRYAGGAVTSASTGVTYFMDRFYQYVTQASKLTVQQVAAPTGFVGFTNAAKITVASAATISATDVFAFDQSVEGYNIADLGWGTANAKPITVSFWAQSSVAGSYPCTVLNASGNRSYINTFTLAANTPTYVSVTFPGDTSGTWGTTNSTGIYLIFGLGVGTTFQGTPNQWNSGNYNGTSTTVQFVANAGATFYITGVQLEKGSTATSFDYRPYGTELALCQRYFETNYPPGYAIGSNSGLDGAWMSVSINGNDFFDYGRATFMVQKRATPTIAQYNPIDGAGNWYDLNIAGANGNVGARYAGTTGFVQYASTGFSTNHAYAIRWYAESEL